MADEAKAKGNAAFSAGDFEEAVRSFTAAISLSPENHVLHSNRSAAYSSLGKFSEALADAQKTVELKPDWGKSYSRLGAAYMGLHNYADAVSAYSKGLEVDSNNEALKSGLADAKGACDRSTRPRPGNPFGEAFGPDMWVKLSAEPSTRAYLQQPDFVKMMQDLSKNPNNLNMYLKDQRFLQALGVLLNVKLQRSPDLQREQEANIGSPGRKRPASDEAEHMAKKIQTDIQSEAIDIPDEDKDRTDIKKEALKEKEAGNAAYKRKDFETAIQHYSVAIELDGEDISFLTNRAAVYLEKGQYEDCIKDCDKAVERGRELRSDFKMVARALTRKGTALVKLAKCSKDYEPAIESFQKALTEHRNPDTLKKLNDAEKAKKELEQLEYFDPQLGDEEREKGNQYFKEQKYPQAVKHYTEAIRRNPRDHKAYSNRAACYTKLGALPQGLEDAGKCIEMDPTFSKGYTRKGAVQFFMKEYDKALETYQEALKHDPQNQESLDGIKRCLEQINKAGRGDVSPEELKERQAKALQDPEIQTILTDPVMRQVLMEMQGNPHAAKQHLKNPLVKHKIQKLIIAGIVQVR